MKNRAFTLIELMVVLALIGIMSAVIIPEMKGSYEDALLRSNARQLISVFNMAYSRAVTLNRLHRVRLDQYTGRYLVEQRQRNGEFAPAPELPGSAGRIDQRISIQMRVPLEGMPDQPGQESGSGGSAYISMPVSEEAVSFYADGTADSREILLRDRAGFGLVLRVNRITARVSIEELARL